MVQLVSSRWLLQPAGVPPAAKVAGFNNTGQAMNMHAWSLDVCRLAEMERDTYTADVCNIRLYILCSHLTRVVIISPNLPYMSVQVGMCVGP